MAQNQSLPPELLPILRQCADFTRNDTEICSDAQMLLQAMEKFGWFNKMSAAEITAVLADVANQKLLDMTAFFQEQPTKSKKANKANKTQAQQGLCLIGGIQPLHKATRTAISKLAAHHHHIRTKTAGPGQAIQYISDIYAYPIQYNL